MTKRRSSRGEARSTLAWLGLLMVVGCFLWLQLLASKFPVGLTSPKAAVEKKAFDLVVIDPGHGGQDSGTIRAGVLEKDLSLDISLRLARLMEAKGLRTLLTRGDDHYISLAGRAEVANRQHSAIFVSIHFDEATRAAATGIETYYAVHQIPPASPVMRWWPFFQPASFATENPSSETLATFVQQALVARTKAFDRGTRAEQFFVIANVLHPAILVEGGFLTNKDDVGKLNGNAYREEMAAAICDGIMRYRATLPADSSS